MSNATTLSVNTRKLLVAAYLGGWQACSVKVLADLADEVDVHGTLDEITARLPETFDYFVLREKVCDEQVLDLIDSLDDIAQVNTSGRLLLAMAERFFLPLLPETHPGHVATRALLSTLADYLNGVVSAETYIGVAFNYRSRYGTTSTSIGTDSEFESLFEAMPSNGLDCPMGEQSWHLGMHWRSFGRFVASRRDTWRLLDNIDDALDYEPLLADPDADLEATEAVRSVILDPERDALIELAMEEFGDAIEALVDAHFPRPA